MEPTAINRPSSAHAIARPSIILHVLLKHGDDVIVSKLDKKLYICLHKVAKGDQWQDVVRIVREKGGVLNMVICEVEVESLVDEVVQEFIKQIDSEINIPVTLVAPDSQLARVLNGTSDSCYYASKGFMQFEVQMKNLSSTGSANGGLVARVSETAPLNEGLRRKNHSDQVDRICLNPAKRARVVWSPELHRVFADAVHKLGIEKAVPKKILELMNTPGLTRENVASHLQKHRMYIKKQQSEAPVQQDGLAGGRQNWVRNPTLPSSRAQPVICRTSQPSNHQIRSFDQVGMKLDPHGVDQSFLNSQIYGCDPSAVGLGEGCPTWSFNYLDMVFGPCNNEQSSLMNIRQQCPNSTSVIASDQGLVEMGQRYVSAGDASLNFGQQHPPDQTNQAELQWRYNVAQHGGSYSADVITFPSLPNVTSHAASP